MQPPTTIQVGAPASYVPVFQNNNLAVFQRTLKDSAAVDFFIAAIPKHWATHPSSVLRHFAIEIDAIRELEKLTTKNSKNKIDVSPAVQSVLPL